MCQMVANIGLLAACFGRPVKGTSKTTYRITGKLTGLFVQTIREGADENRASAVNAGKRERQRWSSLLPFVCLPFVCCCKHRQQNSSLRPLSPLSSPSSSSSPFSSPFSSFPPRPPFVPRPPFIFSEPSSCFKLYFEVFTRSHRRTSCINSSNIGSYSSYSDDDQKRQL